MLAVAAGVLMGWAATWLPPALQVPPPAPAAAGLLTPPRPDHVVVLVMENKDPEQVISDPAQAPYLTSLAPAAAMFTSSYGVARPSQPNYLALFVGDTLGVVSDTCPLQIHGPNLASELIDGGFGFAGYSEDLPGVGYGGCVSADYRRKHNPWADFPDLPQSVNRPWSDFGPDYATLPTVSFVVPNQCHDMHNDECGINLGDEWVKNNMAAYLAWAQQHNSLLVITWDEARKDSAENRIATLFLGPMVRPGRYDERIDHYSVLRTIEDMYRLPHLGRSESATSVGDVWSVPPAG